MQGVSTCAAAPGLLKNDGPFLGEGLKQMS